MAEGGHSAVPLDYRHDAKALPHAWGGPAGSGVLRQRPEDFVVMEELGFQPAGEGEHVWLQVEKTACTTDWLVRHIAALAGVRRHDVGFAGQKDRQAVTRQWFSVYLPQGRAIDWSRLEQCADEARGERIRLLTVTAHRRKLRRGQHRGNRFDLLLRQVQGDPALLQARLQHIAAHGVPNYFGEQRFGREGDNAVRFLHQLGQGRRRVNAMLISAARSWLFNRLLSQRVQAGTWLRVFPGDVLMLAGSQSHFLAEAAGEDLQRRVEQGDLAPTGPLWGRDELPSQAQARQLEQALAEEHGDLCAGLEQLGLQQQRRSLRLAVAELAWQWRGQDLALSFSLPRGGFATAVVRELIRY